MNRCSKAELLARVSAHARQFELEPLVRLLRSRLPEYAICYRGRPSLASEPSLIDRVEFETRRIVIHLNLGLLSSTSPLASYFFRLRHDTRAGPGLEQILNLCNDALLRARAEAMQPLATTEPSAVGAGASFGLRETIWQLHQPSSAVALHWLFKRLFPELEVSVRRVAREHKTPAPLARNGWARLGGTALEAEVSVTVPAHEVTLVADDSDSPNAQPWHEEIAVRIGQLPAARAPIVDATLRVILIDRSSSLCLTLQGAELGFSSLGEAHPPRLTWM